MEQVLDQILNELKTIKSGQDEIKAEVKEINRKTDIIFEQTAGLTEFQTEVKDNLDSIKDELSFICHKEAETEKDVFKIKKHLEIIK